MKDRYQEFLRRKGLRYPSREEIGRRYESVLDEPLIPDDAIRLGVNTTTGRQAYITTEELKTSLHIYGGMGTGKSNTLKRTCRQLIARNAKTSEGVAVFDPHGDVAEHALKVCIELGVDPSRVVYVDLKDRDWSPIINPMRTDGGIIRSAYSLTEAVTRANGVELALLNPMIAEAMISTAIVLLERGCSLAEAKFFGANTKQHMTVRSHLTQGSIVEEFWDEIAGLSPRDRRMETGSSARRIEFFMKFPVIQRMLGQTQAGIDAFRIMEEGGIAIFNLGLSGTEVTTQAMRFAGTMFLDMFKNASLRRKKNKAKPFYLLIDEFAYFTSYDTMEALAEARGFGLRGACQRV